MWKRGKRPAGNMSILLIGNSNVYNNVLGGWGILRHFLIKKGRWNSHNASKMRRKLNLKDICQCMAIVFHWTWVQVLISIRHSTVYFIGLLWSNTSARKKTKNILCGSTFKWSDEDDICKCTVYCKRWTNIKLYKGEKKGPVGDVVQQHLGKNRQWVQIEECYRSKNVLCSKISCACPLILYSGLRRQRVLKCVNLLSNHWK